MHKLGLINVESSKLKVSNKQLNQKLKTLNQKEYA